MGENSPHSLENPPGIGASSEVKDGDGLCPVEMSQVRHADAEGAARVLNACSRLTFPGFVLVVFWTGRKSCMHDVLDQQTSQLRSQPCWFQFARSPLPDEAAVEAHA